MNSSGMFNLLNIIFFMMILYFITLTMCSIYRIYITARGIFFILIIVLFLLLFSLSMNFNNIFLYNQTFFWEWLLVHPSKLFPEISISIYLDNLAFLFIFLVCIIGFATNIYILNYFKYEANEDIFTLFINWFILSMMLLVLANNFFTLFLGWELIGLTSFFLINFWNERRGTLKASFKAFVFNKVSDFFLFIFIIYIWILTGKSNIYVLNAELVNSISIETKDWYIIGFSLIICSSIKSAQVLGHLWLPDSMEAPVPASALIHSATLVSAGVYLLLRFSFLISYLQLHYFIILLGAITAAYGGIVAASQTDVKKLLAYSTISHCGFLFVCTGLQNYYLVIIYLFLHGLFKAMTFFCVGSFIRVANSQDTRQMGVMSRLIPVDTIFLIICASNLGGLPFTIGYLYKNLFMIFLVNSAINFIITGFCFIGMLCSIIYVYRLVYYCAFDINKSYINLTLKQLQDNPTFDKNLWSFSTVVQAIVIFFMLSVSIALYVIFYNYFNFSSLILEHFPLYFESDPTLLKDNEYLYGIYINFFYVLYILIIFIIIVIDCRRSYSWQNKLFFLLFLILTTFSLVLIFNL